MEIIAKSKGLSLNNQNDPATEQLFSLNFAETKKKFIVNNSINSIQKKFYAKFDEQKTLLETIIRNHNMFIKDFSSNNNSATVQNTNEGLINEESFPLMVEIEKVLSDLKISLPIITSKLPWSSNKLYRQRASTSDEYSSMRK